MSHKSQLDEAETISFSKPQAEYEMTSLQPDELYPCPFCDTVYFKQIPYERHLFHHHGHLRDTLDSIT